MTKKTSIPSFTQSRKSYIVDIISQVCDCPDWQDRRSIFPQNDPRRLCKHLILQIVSSGEVPPALLDIFPILDRINNVNQRGFPMARAWETITAARHTYDIFIPFSGENDWANVHDGSETWWGYNLFEKRWSYNRRPRGFTVLEKAIKRLASETEDIRYPTPTSANSPDDQPNILRCPACNMEYEPSDVAGKPTCPICGSRFDGKAMSSRSFNLDWRFSDQGDKWIKIGLIALVSLILILFLVARKH